MRLHTTREPKRASRNLDRRTQGNPSGSEDGLAKAIEIVATPAIFAVVGFGLDRWWGTGPWLALSMGMVTFVLKLLTEWYRYTERMQGHQDELAAARPAQRRGLDRASGDESSASLPTGVVLESAEPSVGQTVAAPQDAQDHERLNRSARSADSVVVPAMTSPAARAPRAVHS